MSHEILDYSLIAAILGWVTKQGVEVFRPSKKSNSVPSLEDIRRVTGEILDRHNVLLTDIRDTQRETLTGINELVTIARMKLN